jgi:putative transposase
MYRMVFGDRTPSGCENPIPFPDPGVRCATPGFAIAPFQGANSADDVTHQVLAMPQSLAQIYLHLVFSTKERRPYLQDLSLRDESHHYLGGICNQLDCPVIRVGGASDHVHVLSRLSRTVTVAGLVRELKLASAKWFKSRTEQAGPFQWQSGYGAFSVSPGHVEALVAYIENQERHHRTESFQDEFRRLLLKYDTPWDERYVWD